jgi:serine/threonine-protein kinase
MAPEQLAGGEVTPRSDIYALGLVLYELFTGRRALDGRNLAEIMARREQDGITQPSTIVRDLDPAIERAIMRCLETEPARRPGSALAVAASLPGGDPLAAALAAGETPSPEMVAAAGKTSALKPLGAIAGLALALGLLVLSVVLADRMLVTSIVPLPKPPMLLVERAKQILLAAGHGRDAVDSAHAFMPANFLGYLETHPELNTPQRLRSGEPATLHFWYRGSPIVMVPTGNQVRVSQTDPPMTVADMSMVVLDPEGRLVSMAVVPPQLDPPPVSGPPPGPVDWKPLFDAAGLDIGTFTTVAPEWTPSHYADTRAAWTGPQPAIPDLQLRIEAGTYRGNPVYFLRAAAWTRPSRAATTIVEHSSVTWAAALTTIAISLMFVAAGLIARHNVRKGRGDRRGAFQLAAFVSVVAFFVWLLNAKHVANPNIEMGRFFEGQPLWAAGLLGLLYLAVEPYVRRFWPTTVVSWSRLMARQWRDPLVGRDILFGVALGVLVHVLQLGSGVLTQKLGHVLPPAVPALDDLLGTRFVLAEMGDQVFNAVLNAIFCVFGMVLLKIMVRSEWAAVGVAIVFFTFTSSRSMSGTGVFAINLATLVLFISIIVLTIQRLGLLATVVLFLTDFVIADAAITLDTSRWFFADSLLVLLVPVTMACYGFYASRGGEPLLGRRMLD